MGALLRRLGAARPVESVGPPSWPFIWLPVVSYGSFILLTAADVGVRYLIPIFPFLFTALGRLGAALWPARIGKVILGVLLLLHVHAAVMAWPDPISYFNGLFGCRGPAGIKCLDDSNFDWGQDIGRVAATVNRIRRPGETVALLYFGTGDPGAYLTDWQEMRPQEVLRPGAALYAVSLHRFHWMVDKLGRPNGMDWYELFRPSVIVGNTYFIYDFRGGVPAHPAPQRTRPSR